MNIFKWIKAWFEKNYTFPEDTRMSQRDLLLNLSKEFRGCYVEITDDDKYLVDVVDMMRFLQLNLFSALKYKAEKFDCEDFSRVLDALFALFNGRHACGVVHVNTRQGKHALNCFIDVFGAFYYIEPQNNHIFRPIDKPDYTPYFIRI